MLSFETPETQTPDLRTVTVTNYGGPVLFTESREFASVIRRIEPVLERAGDSPQRPEFGLRLIGAWDSPLRRDS